MQRYLYAGATGFADLPGISCLIRSKQVSFESSLLWNRDGYLLTCILMEFLLFCVLVIFGCGKAQAFGVARSSG